MIRCWNRAYLVYSGKNEYAITPHGRVWLAALGMDLNHSASRSPFARSCLDWSERKPHLAGRLAAQLLDSFFEQRWIVRIRETRAVRITERGIREFERQYGLRLDRAARRATRF